LLSTVIKSIKADHKLITVIIQHYNRQNCTKRNKQLCSFTVHQVVNQHLKKASSLLSQSSGKYDLGVLGHWVRIQLQLQEFDVLKEDFYGDLAVATLCKFHAHKTSVTVYDLSHSHSQHVICTLLLLSIKINYLNIC